MPDRSVRIGELHVADGTADLVAIGLGSCVGLVIGDRSTGVAGMAHVMLPAAQGRSSATAGRFADQAVPALLDAVLAAGARRGALRAWMAGGAHMFAGGIARRDIGSQNVEAVLAGLSTARVPVQARETGGDRGRTLRLGVDGVLRVNLAGASTQEIGTLRALEAAAA